MKRKKNNSPIIHTSHKQFYDYYAQESESEKTLQRFINIRDTVLRLMDDMNEQMPIIYNVADIGCGAATQCLLWAKSGHRVHGMDINGPLLELAQKRAHAAGLEIDLRLGTAIDIPWGDNSMDVCLVPELLEHVAEWRECLDEITRIVKPGGGIYISTTNILCPIQQEFNLPFYSWYPTWLKHYYERASVTDRPELVNHAKYPAVNWFSLYSLRRDLRKHGFQVMDRFDMIDMSKIALSKRLILSLICSNTLTRFIAHVLTPYTQIFAKKKQ